MNIGDTVRLKAEYRDYASLGSGVVEEIKDGMAKIRMDTGAILIVRTTILEIVK